MGEGVSCARPGRFQLLAAFLYASPNLPMIHDDINDILAISLGNQTI